MSLNRFHLTVVTIWFAALLAVLGLRIVMDVPTSIVEGMGLILLGCAPALILVSVFRGAPPQTIAQVLYDAEQDANAGRDALARLHDRKEA